MTTTPDTLGPGGGIISPATNSATTGVDGDSIIPGVAMFLGGFVEKNAASTLVSDINTSTDLGAATPSVTKLTKSQKRAAKRVATSPLEAANAKS
jgi:hypothetical protein